MRLFHEVPLSHLLGHTPLCTDLSYLTPLCGYGRHASLVTPFCWKYRQV